MDTMNADIMACHTVLRPDKPTYLTTGTPAWVKILLQSAGWKENDPVPTGLNEYFPQVIQLLDLPVTPASAREVIKRDDVLMTLQSKLKQAYQVAHQEDIVKEQVSSLLGEASNYNPEVYEALQQVVQSTVEKDVDTQLKKEINFESETEIDASYEEKPEVEEVTTEEPKVTYTVCCPRCALSLVDKYEPFETTDIDKEDYLFHVLGGKRYYKIFPIFNGLGEVMLQTPTAEEFDKVRIATCIWENEHRDLPASLISDRYFATYLLFSVASIKIRKEIPIIPYTDLQFSRDTLPASIQAYMDYWYSNVVVSSELRNELIALVSMFISHVSKLREELYNRDFWNGVVVR